MISKIKNINVFSNIMKSKLSIVQATIIFLVLSNANYLCQETNTTKKVRVRQREFLRGGDRPVSTSKTTTTPTPSITTPKNLTLTTAKFELSDNWTTPVTLPATGNHTATIIFLHGVGSTGNGWAYSMAHLRPSFMKVVCPSAQEMPTSFHHNEQPRIMSSWFNQAAVDDVNAESKGLEHSNAYIQKLIDEEIKNGIPSERIILGGYSQGAAMALHCGATYPKKLGGIIAYCGWLPLLTTFFQTYHPSQRDIPMLIGHGHNDDIVPYNVGQLCGQSLKRISKNVEFKGYKEGKHEVTAAGMIDIKKFILKCLS